MKVLVGSVHAETPRASTWLRLQKTYLQKTSIDYEFCVYCNRVDSKLFDVPVVGHNTSPLRDIPYKKNRASAQSYDHCDGLNELLSHFRKTPADCYLIMDSDCFPIKENWVKELLSKTKDHDFAAPIRTENLDTFPHPCALFIKNKSALEKIRFHVSESKSIAGELIEDVMPDLSGRCYPLVRTNRRNVHPIFGAIYGNLFYHHGCGSRFAGTRATSFGVYGDIDHVEIEASMYDMAANSTDKLIQRLTTVG